MTDSRQFTLIAVESIPRTHTRSHLHIRPLRSSYGCGQRTESQRPAITRFTYLHSSRILFAHSSIRTNKHRPVIYGLLRKHRPKRTETEALGSLKCIWDCPCACVCAQSTPQMCVHCGYVFIYVAHYRPTAHMWKYQCVCARPNGCGIAFL